MARQVTDAHWRDSVRTPRLFFFDYRAAFPLLALLFFPNKITLFVAVLAIMFFWMLERFGFTLPIFFRWLRAKGLAGNYKKSKPWWYN